MTITFLRKVLCKDVTSLVIFQVGSIIGQADNTDRREFGMGLVGRVFDRRFKTSVRQHPVVRQQMDDFEDYRLVGSVIPCKQSK